MLNGKSHTALIVGLIAIQVVLLVFFAFFRLVDGDESFYLSAGREVAQGQVVYADFFYPQMPYLPYILSVFAGHGFTSLYLSRLASVLAALCTTLVLAVLLRKITRDDTTTAILLALYVFSGFVIAWHSVAKTYAWADLFLLLSFAGVVYGMEKHRLPLIGLAGGALALAINTRLVLLPIIPVFMYYAMRNFPGKRLLSGVSFLSGAVLCSLPSLALLWQDSNRYFLDNFGFHLMRNPGQVFPETFVERAIVLGKMAINPQVLIVVAIIVGALMVRRKAAHTTWLKALFASPSGLAAAMAIVITIVYLIPNPIHQQYFVQALPFALLGVAGQTEKGWGSLLSFIPAMRRDVVMKAMLGIYVLGLIPYGVIFVGAVRDSDGNTNMSNMKRISAFLSQAPDSLPILAEHPIIPVLAGKPVCAGAEFLGYEYPLPLDESHKKYYRLITNDELKQMLDNRTASYFVFIDRPDTALVASAEANYEPEASFGRYQVYRRKQ